MELEKAYRYATLARDTFQQRYNDCQNEKIMISVAHAEYTMALVLCHLCKQKNYLDCSLNTKAATLQLLTAQFRKEFMRSNYFISILLDFASPHAQVFRMISE